MSNHNDPKLQARRRLLKSLTLGSSVATAVSSTPEIWTRPVIDSVMLPAHAQTSFEFTCSIPFSFEFEASKSSPGIEGTYEGTQFAAGPFFGDCTDTGIQFGDSSLQIVIEPTNSEQVRYIVNGETIFERVLNAIVLAEVFTIVIIRLLTFNQYPARETTEYEMVVNAENGDMVLTGSATGTLEVDEASLVSGP